MDSFKDQGMAIVSLEPSELDITQLRQYLSAGLFGPTDALVIKNILSTTKSKSKEKILDLLKGELSDKIVIYESKNISATVLKPFGKHKIESFSISPIIFKFVDCLRPHNSRQILLGWKKLLDTGHEPEYIFSMVVRQVRLLIQAKSGPSYLKMAPYPKKLVMAQSDYFTLNSLLSLHSRLLEIDMKIKTGTSTLDLEHLLPSFFNTF